MRDLGFNNKIEEAFCPTETIESRIWTALFYRRFYTQCYYTQWGYNQGPKMSRKVAVELIKSELKRDPTLLLFAVYDKSARTIGL